MRSVSLRGESFLIRSRHANYRPFHFHINLISPLSFLTLCFLMDSHHSSIRPPFVFKWSLLRVLLGSRLFSNEFRSFSYCVFCWVLVQPARGLFSQRYARLASVFFNLRPQGLVHLLEKLFSRWGACFAGGKLVQSTVCLSSLWGIF